MRTPGDNGFTVAQQDVGNWIHKPVYSSDNRKVGEIVELKRGPDDRVTDVYMDTESFLGMEGTATTSRPTRSARQSPTVSS